MSISGGRMLSELIPGRRMQISPSAHCGKNWRTLKSHTLMPAFKPGPESRILLLEPCKKCAGKILPLPPQNVVFPLLTSCIPNTYNPVDAAHAAWQPVCARVIELWCAHGLGVANAQ